VTPEEAIQTAIQYENRIRDLYAQALEGTRDPAGRRVFGALAADEQRHVDYLEHKLRQWREQGRIDVERLDSPMPAPEAIARSMGTLETRMSREARSDEKRMLAKALQVEVETSRFYERLVAEMPAGARDMFARFMEIENGHIAVVQAELDHLSHNGYWFDFQEFDMEY
jgi:rubrerythrin